MANPYKYRDLFKPILNTAARAAYRMKEGMGPGIRKAQQSPYTQAYWDLASGKKGKIAQGFAIGAPIYAGSKLMVKSLILIAPHIFVEEISINSIKNIKKTWLKS